MLANSTLIEARRIAGTKLIVPDDTTKLEIQQVGASRLEGTFRVCVDDTGVVESVLPMKSTGISDYDSLLIGNMRRWRYSPFKIDDEAVPVCTYVTFIYTQR